MKPKMIVKLCIDLLMTVLLLALTARQITGNSAHEWLGAGMFALWIAHHVLNRSWHGRLFCGKYTPFRAVQLVISLLLFLAMAGTAVSGVILSREAVAVYGLYAFLKNQIFSYLFLTSSFVYFDFERPAFLFFAEYTAMMGLFVFLAHYGGRGLQRVRKGTSD